jgi:hypothetical protein
MSRGACRERAGAVHHLPVVGLLERWLATSVTGFLGEVWVNERD